MKRLILISLFFSFLVSNKSQQDAMFTYYMFNHQSVNPAYVGSKDVINATMINRSQWTGFEGAPWSHTICVNTPLVNESLGCLLYTSPSPRDVEESRMPSSA